MEQIYKNIMLASFSVMYAYGLFSIFTLSPKGKEYDNYRISRKVFGVIMIMWATYLVFHWHFNPRLHDPVLASTLCFSCYFPGIMLFEVAFSYLISGVNYPIRRRIKRIIVYAIYINIVVFTNYFFFPPNIQKIVFVVTDVVFAFEMIYLSLIFLKTYRNALKRADNYYSDNIDIFIRWMPKSIYIAIGFGFTASILFFSDNCFMSIYMAGGLILFTYIFISYQNYMINITKMKEVLLVENNKKSASSDIKNSEITNEIDINKSIMDTNLLEIRISEWIDSKGFTKRGLTIDELALHFGTNRTYLSTYINTIYKVSFREWIARHRIEYAKELLVSSEDLSSAKIAEMVGYTPNAFTSIFSKAEKITPIQWRNAKK